MILMAKRELSNQNTTSRLQRCARMVKQEEQENKEVSLLEIQAP